MTDLAAILRWRSMVVDVVISIPPYGWEAATVLSR